MTIGPQFVELTADVSSEYFYELLQKAIPTRSPVILRFFGQKELTPTLEQQKIVFLFAFSSSHLLPWHFFFLFPSP